MLSLDKCRRILGPHCDLSDDDIESLRDQLCDLAVVTIAGLKEQQQVGVVEEREGVKPERISEDDRDEVEKREAI